MQQKSVLSWGQQAEEQPEAPQEPGEELQTWEPDGQPLEPEEPEALARALTQPGPQASVLAAAEG